MTGPGKPAWRRRAPLAAVVMLALAAGLALGAGGSAPRAAGVPRPVAAPRSVAEAGEPAGPGPYEMVEGVGVGFSHDEAGAVAAAMSYTAAPQAWLYRADDQVGASAQAVTVPAARDDVVPEVVEDARLLRNQVTQAQGTVWFVVAPLATRIESYRDTHATVRVWAVRVLSADGVAVPQSGWHTVTFYLAWDAGDWRIAGVDETEGPTPQLETGLEPWAAGYLDQELAGFVRVGAS